MTSWVRRMFFLCGLGLLVHGGYYAAQAVREVRYLEGLLAGGVDGVTPGQRVEETLELAFAIPPHKGPAPAPDYDLANPGLRVLGPPASLIHQRGGHCGRRSRLLIALLSRQGIPARKIHLINGDYARFDHASEYVHAVVEARVDDRWIVVDPLYDVVYRRRDGAMASLEDIRRDPAIFKEGIARADTTYTPYYPTLYTFDQYRKFIWSSLPGGQSAYGLLSRLFGPETAREIPTPLILETPYQALAGLSISGGFVLLIVGALLRRPPWGSSGPRDLPSPPELV